jgi:hypothetical protein
MMAFRGNSRPEEAEREAQETKGRALDRAIYLNQSEVELREMTCWLDMQNKRAIVLLNKASERETYRNAIQSMNEWRKTPSRLKKGKKRNNKKLCPFASSACDAARTKHMQREKKKSEKSSNLM